MLLAQRGLIETLGNTAAGIELGPQQPSSSRWELSGAVLLAQGEFS